MPYSELKFIALPHELLLKKVNEQEMRLVESVVDSLLKQQNV